MKISFLMPGSGHIPSGGFKIIYEYANRLSRHGHEITLLHTPNALKGRNAKDRILSTGSYLYRNFYKSFYPSGWFLLEPSIDCRWVRSLSEGNIPDAQVIVASAWQTAEWIETLPQRCGEKFYLIQHYETWSGSTTRVDRTWRLPLQRIVVSKWLQEVGEGLGVNAHYVSNAIDFSAFGLDRDTVTRGSNSILMMYHDYPWKGSQDGLAAVTRLRNTRPDINLTLFGVGARPRGLPEWVNYVRQPSQALLRSLYNNAAIFIAPSLSEGWGLPGAEAMACGCAVVCSDAGGHREFARSGDNAMVYPAGDIDALFTCLEKMSSDHSLRFSLARAGCGFIQKFTWEKSVNKLEAIFRASIKP